MPIGDGPTHEGERRQGELGDLIGPQEGRVEKAARNHIGEDGAKLADQRHGDHRIGERVDDGGHWDAFRCDRITHPPSCPTHGPHPEEAALFARPSRRMAAGTASPAAVLPDARKSALLRTRLMDDVDIIRAIETLY